MHERTYSKKSVIHIVKVQVMLKTDVLKKNLSKENAKDCQTSFQWLQMIINMN